MPRKLLFVSPLSTEPRLLPVKEMKLLVAVQSTVKPHPILELARPETAPLGGSRTIESVSLSPPIIWSVNRGPADSLPPAKQTANSKPEMCLVSFFIDVPSLFGSRFPGHHRRVVIVVD